MKKTKKFLIIFLLLILYILTYGFSYSSSVLNNISNNFFRLHIIANSNSVEDQNLKYLVRDKLIEYMSSICKNISSKEESIKLVEQNLDSFKEIAQKVIYDNNFNYDVNVEIGNFYFPTKTYGDISLPAGLYDALKVKIGNASGKNWWCVMFPSLCFTDISNGIVPEESKENLRSSLTSEEYNLISSNNSEYKFKFKLVELFENTKFALTKK